MRHSETLSKIAPALTKAQAAMKGVAKSGNNKFDNYRYANLEDYTEEARPILSANGLSIFYSVTDVEALQARTTSNGKTEHVVRLRMTITIMHESGEWIEIDSFGEGQDRADKAIYKATTGARKYGIACALGLVTTDDPDGDERVGVDDQPTPPQRATPPRQEEAKSPKIALRDLVIQWSGCKPEDANANCKRVFAACKLPENAKLTDDQIGLALAWVQKCMKSNSPFDGAC